jgi:AcrR family transcriptional regulator
LDNTERLILDEGYAAVSYRTVASMSGVTPWAVQYYFPTLDDLFLALLRARTQHNLDRLKRALQTHPDDPLRVIWDHSRDEVTAALMLELMALANHRKSIRAEITRVGERLREVWLKALPDAGSGYKLPSMEVPTSVVLFLLAGIPKLLLLEGAFDLELGHTETVGLVETSIQRAEPPRA